MSLTGVDSLDSRTVQIPGLSVAWLSPAEERKITDLTESFRSARLTAATWTAVYEKLVQLCTGLATTDRAVVTAARLELLALSPQRGFSIADATTAPSGVVELLNNIEGSLQADPSPDPQSVSQRDERL